ncbi:hypothetical protein [Vibrio cincinnatiensis]|uniref:hypothetical protein n=1 Tax=Vibrio cincinnatiensis TaxID=675 RepID=UPI0038AE8644
MRSIICISIVMLSGCSNLSPRHDTAIIIYKNNPKIQLASYKVESVINYPELKETDLYHEGKVGDMGSISFVSECDGDKFNMPIHPVILYRAGEDFRLAYPYKYKCKINGINIRSYLQSKNDAVIKEREIKSIKKEKY